MFFSPYPRAYPAEPMNEIVEPILRARGIEIFTFFDVDRIDPATRTIYSIEGDQIQYDLPIIIPPFVGADIAYEPAGVLDGEPLRGDRQAESSQSKGLTTHSRPSGTRRTCLPQRQGWARISRRRSWQSS